MSLFSFVNGRLYYAMGLSSAPKPQVIYLVVNSKCNLSCSMCDIGSKRKDSQFYKVMNKGCDIGLDLIKKLADECTWKPTFAITSTEPLLYKPLFEAIDYIKQNGNKVQLTTNGLLLPNYSEKIVRSKVDDLWVSIDGPERIHNQIRLNNFSWGNALQGIYDVHAWKKELETDLPKVHINYTINKDNFSNLLEFLASLNSFKTEWSKPDYYNDLISDVTFSHLNLVTYGMMAKHNELHGNLLATEASAAREDATVVDTDVLWESDPAS